MLEVKMDGHRAIIDVRERVLKGEHPKGEIFQYVKGAPIGTIFEIHLPHKGEPLVAGLSNFGMNVITNELAPGHFRLISVKLNEIQ